MLVLVLRTLAFLFLTMAPALAWEAKTGRVCQLDHESQHVSVRISYDPAIPEYSIAITPERRWLNGPVFSMRFEGLRGNTIMTDRHVLSSDGATLTVTDSGFGNVLNGLEFNQTATALLGDRAVDLPLDGAAPAVRAFRACTSGVNV